MLAFSPATDAVPLIWSPPAPRREPTAAVAAACPSPRRGVAQPEAARTLDLLGDTAAVRQGVGRAATPPRHVVPPFVADSGGGGGGSGANLDGPYRRPPPPPPPPRHDQPVLLEFTAPSRLHHSHQGSEVGKENPESPELLPKRRCGGGERAAATAQGPPQPTRTIIHLRLSGGDEAPSPLAQLQRAVHRLAGIPGAFQQLRGGGRHLTRDADIAAFLDEWREAAGEATGEAEAPLAIVSATVQPPGHGGRRAAIGAFISAHDAAVRAQQHAMIELLRSNGHVLANLLADRAAEAAAEGRRRRDASWVAHTSRSVTTAATTTLPPAAAPSFSAAASTVGRSEGPRSCSSLSLPPAPLCLDSPARASPLLAPTLRRHDVSSDADDGFTARRVVLSPLPHSSSGSMANERRSSDGDGTGEETAPADVVDAASDRRHSELRQRHLRLLPEPEPGDEFGSPAASEMRNAASAPVGSEAAPRPYSASEASHTAQRDKAPATAHSPSATPRSRPATPPRTRPPPTTSPHTAAQTSASGAALARHAQREAVVPGRTALLPPPPPAIAGAASESTSHRPSSSSSAQQAPQSWMLQPRASGA